MTEIDGKKLIEYRDSDGSICPFCGSPKITTLSSFDEVSNFKTASCDDCDEIWNDVYNRVGIEHDGDMFFFEDAKYTREVELIVCISENDGGRWYTTRVEVDADLPDDDAGKEAIRVLEQEFDLGGTEVAFVGVYNLYPDGNEV